MQKMFLHLQKVLDEFPDSYVVIGGLAATLLGAPRTTVDVDVVMLLSPQEVERTVRICEQQGLHPSADAVVRLKEGRPVKFAFGDSLDISYLEEQVCLLREEAGLPSMMERWHSIHSRLIAPDVSPEDDPEELSDGWLGKAGV